MQVRSSFSMVESVAGNWPVRRPLHFSTVWLCARHWRVNYPGWFWKCVAVPSCHKSSRIQLPLALLPSSICFILPGHPPHTHSFTDMDAAHRFFGDCYCLLVFHLKWCILLLWFLMNSRCHWQATTDIWNHEWQWRSGSLGFLFGFTKTCVITLQIIVSVFFRVEVLSRHPSPPLRSES